MDYEPYKKSIIVILGGLCLSLIAVAVTLLFNMFGKWSGLVFLPVNIFNYWYLSKSPVPYLYGLMSIISVVLVVLRQSKHNEKSQRWMAYPVEKLILSSINYFAVGIVEELERWSFIFFYSLPLLFLGNLLNVGRWEYVILVSILMVTLVSYFGHGKRDWFGNLLLLLHLVIYSFVILFYGLYTAMVIHIATDLSIAFTEFWIRIRK